MEPDLEPEVRAPKKKIFVWVIAGFLFFGGINALAFFDGYKGFISDLKTATVKSWEDVKGDKDDMKLVASIDLKTGESIKIEEDQKENNFISKIITRTTNGDDDPPTIVEEEELPVKLLITEIRLGSDSSAKDEFVEIYNPSEKDVSLSGWYLQKKTRTGSLSSFAKKELFENKIIKAKGYFVIANPSSQFKFDISTAAGLADNNSLILKNQKGEIINKVGWGSSSDCEESCAPNPLANSSIHRKIKNNAFVESKNNFADFSPISCSTPAEGKIDCPEASKPLMPIVIPPTNQEPLLPQNSSEPETTESSPNPIPTPEPGPKALKNVLISVVQVRGSEADNDFIVIYNPNGKSIDISSWNVRKRTQAGSDSSIRVFEAGSVIPPFGSFTWANSKNNFHLTLNSNTWSSASLASNNSIVLLDKEKRVLDSLAWGEGHINPYIEGSAIPNPEPGILIKRKFEGEDPVDTNNNSSDFLVK